VEIYILVRWALDPQPEIVLSARSTPWPEEEGLSSTSMSRQTRFSSIFNGNKSPAHDGKSNPSEQRVDATKTIRLETSSHKRA
jgi:hypothetical protein